MRSRRFARGLGLVAALYLVGMAVVFALLSVEDAAFARSAVRTEGTVIALVARAPLGSTRDARPDARTPSLAPKVSYTADGQTYTYTSAHGRYRQRLQVGDRVTVLYAPGDPASARLRGEGQALGPAISVGFGLAAVGVVLVVLRSRPRRDGPRSNRRPARAGTPRSSGVAD